MHHPHSLDLQSVKAVARCGCQYYSIRDNVMKRKKLQKRIDGIATSSLQLQLTTRLFHLKQRDHFPTQTHIPRPAAAHSRSQVATVSSNRPHSTDTDIGSSVERCCNNIGSWGCCGHFSRSLQCVRDLANERARLRASPPDSPQSAWLSTPGTRMRHAFP